MNVDKALAQDDPTNDSPINFTVEFDEDVADFAAGDLTLSGSAGATTKIVTGGPQVYNVAVSGMTSDGDVTLDFTGIAHDSAGNANEAPTYGDNTVEYDTTGPTVDVDKALAVRTTRRTCRRSTSRWSSTRTSPTSTLRI